MKRSILAIPFGGKPTKRTCGGLRRSLAVLSVLVLAMAPRSHAAPPLPVRLLSAENTTWVNVPYGPDASPSSPIVSPVPITSSISYQGHLEAQARADLLEVECFTAASDAQIDRWLSIASALTTLTFTPEIDSSQTINIAMSGWAEAFFSAQFVRLVEIDIANSAQRQELWSYGGYFEDWQVRAERLLPPGITYETEIPWVEDYNGDTRYTADINPITDFMAGHIYELTLYTTSESNPPDAEHILIQLSGLEIIPEPTTFSLLGLGSLALVMVRRRK